MEKLELDRVMENQKSFCFFPGDAFGMDESRIDESIDMSLDLSFNSNTDKSTLFEMKKYKNLMPEDVKILKGLKLKISNYVLKESDKVFAQVQEMQRKNEENAKLQALLECPLDFAGAIQQMTIKAVVDPSTQIALDKYGFIE